MFQGAMHMDEQTPEQYTLRMPSLELPSAMHASIWHARKGSKVVEGDRLLEVCAGEVIIDIPSPATGTLLRRLVREDDPIDIGQALAIIECTGS
jgi:pyruvate/2-oxoglutarate dehydrogenase complex dihydrolipoamide acyltransferase (E2) component